MTTTDNDGELLTTREISRYNEFTNKPHYGTASVTKLLDELQQDILAVSEEGLKLAVENKHDLPIFDLESTLSKCDKAASEVALLSINAQDLAIIFKSVAEQGGRDTKLAKEAAKMNRVLQAHNADAQLHQVPVVQDLLKNYRKQLSKGPEKKLNDKARISKLRTSDALKKHKQKLFWTLLPEIDMEDKWHKPIGIQVAKHWEGAPSMDHLDDDVDDDDDLVASGGTSVLKCPIAGSYLEEPVRSTKCVHVFSKAAFESYVRETRGAVDCPVSGCNGRFTSVSDCVPDEAIALRVEGFKQQEREARQRNTQRI